MSEVVIAIPQTAKETMSLPDPDLLQYYKDMENRVIWITGEINDSIYDTIQLILQYNRDDREVEPEQRKPIRLIISSPGGYLTAARTLISIMRLSQTPIYTIAMGEVASAASLIYLASNKRYAIKGASFLYHKGGCEGLEGDYAKIDAFMENYKKDIQELVDFYKRYTKFDEKTIETELTKGDWYIRLDEALENGVVDEVIEDIDILL